MMKLLLLFGYFIDFIKIYLWRPIGMLEMGNTRPPVSCYVPTAFFHILHAVRSPEGGSDEGLQGSDVQL